MTQDSPIAFIASAFETTSAASWPRSICSCISATRTVWPRASGSGGRRLSYRRDQRRRNARDARRRRIGAARSGRRAARALAAAMSRCTATRRCENGLRTRPEQDRDDFPIDDSGAETRRLLAGLLSDLSHGSIHALAERGQFRCLCRKANVPWPWIVCGPLKNSISVRSPSPACRSAGGLWRIPRRPIRPARRRRRGPARP